MLRSAPLVLLLLAACAPGSKVADAVEEFADRACKCADVACLDKVEADYQDWYGKQKGARGAEKQRNRVAKALGRYAECSEALRNPEPAGDES